ncbi:MAG TPA: carboxylesterase family protein [Candidatus Coprenecus pullistercoris]|nr:carboxylesterase family protein [Candidatus Coprenecus pullistercoris]
MKTAERIILVALAAAFTLSSCRGSSEQLSDTDTHPYAEAAEAVTSHEGTEILAHAADSTREILMETEIFAIKGADTLKLDRYFLSGMEQTDSPVVVFVFGGGFRFGERYSEMFVPYFEFLARHGCTVVSIDYRTMLGRITFDGRPSPVDFMNILQSAIDTAVVDLYDATRYIAQQREAWGIDPEKIIISGSSAGAITVLQAEYYRCNSHSLAARLPEGFRYAGVISFAGAISDKKKLHWQTLPCPVMLFHGNADGIVPFRKAHLPFLGGLWGSETIARSLESLDSPCHFYEIDNAGHEIASLPMSRNLYDIAAFLSRQVIDGKPLSVHTFETVPGAPAAKKRFTVLDYIRNNT